MLAMFFLGGGDYLEKRCHFCSPDFYLFTLDLTKFETTRSGGTSSIGGVGPCQRRYRFGSPQENILTVNLSRAAVQPDILDCTVRVGSLTRFIYPRKK